MIKKFRIILLSVILAITQVSCRATDVTQKTLAASDQAPAPFPVSTDHKLTLDLETFPKDSSPNGIAANGISQNQKDSLTAYNPLDDSRDNIDIATDQTLKLVVLPDTQYYPHAYPETFNAITRWISEKWDSENFDFVVHLGDIVHKVEWEQEWQRAAYAMSLLGNRPYTVLPGNHDYIYVENETTDYHLFNKYFPASILAKYDQYPNKGTYPAETMINNYVNVNGYLILSIQFCYDRALNPGLRDWIKATLSENAKIPTIVVTHDFLSASGELSIPGEQLWGIIKDYPNVFLVLSGHATTDDLPVKQEQIRTIVGTKGNIVNAAMSNYQDYLARNSGYFRIYKITTHSIEVQTFSPIYGYMADNNSQFVLLR